MAELTGHDAVTVHRLLELKPGGDAAYGKDRPLDADLVVVDEASMLDVLLANKLTKAIAPGAHPLFAGDVDQLPSVGAGEVLRDLLTPSTPIPHVRLTQIFRQASHSGVVTNAHRINAGDYPRTHGLDDFFHFAVEDAEQAAQVTVDVVARRIPAKFGLDPRHDIQVLTPMHRGATGAGVLNTLLQEALTPARTPPHHPGLPAGPPIVRPSLTPRSCTRHPRYRLIFQVAHAQVASTAHRWWWTVERRLSASLRL